MICCILLDDDEVKTSGKTRSWIKRGKQRGARSNIVHQLRMEDTASFKEILRMDYDIFLNLLAAIEPFISSQESYHGVPTIKANERLTLTLRFLATGETFRSLGFQFRISRSAISYIVISVCEALINHLGNLYLKTQFTNEEWMSVAREFQEKWRFPKKYCNYPTP